MLSGLPDMRAVDVFGCQAGQRSDADDNVTPMYSVAHTGCIRVDSEHALTIIHNVADKISCHRSYTPALLLADHSPSAGARSLMLKVGVSNAYARRP